MDRGELVPDDVMLGLIEQRLGQPDVANGFILDGYPRNLAQAEALEQSAAAHRPAGRRGGAHRGELKTWSWRGLPSAAAEEGRSDDTEEVVRNRMRVYQEQTAPVAGFFEQRDLLTRVLGEGAN